MLETQKRIGILMQKGVIEKVIFKDNGDIKAYIRYAASPICVKDLESLADTAESLDVVPTVSEKTRTMFWLYAALFFMLPTLLALNISGGPLDALLACLSGLCASVCSIIFIYRIIFRNQKP